SAPLHSAGALHSTFMLLPRNWADTPVGGSGAGVTCFHVTFLKYRLSADEPLLSGSTSWNSGVLGETTTVFGASICTVSVMVWKFGVNVTGGPETFSFPSHTLISTVPVPATCAET